MSKPEIEFYPWVSARVERLLSHKQTSQWARDSFDSIVRNAGRWKPPEEEQNASLLIKSFDDLTVLLTAVVWHYQDVVPDYRKRMMKGVDGTDPEMEFCGKCGSIAVKKIMFAWALIDEVFGEDEEAWEVAARPAGCGCDCKKRSRGRSRRRCQGREQ